MSINEQILKNKKKIRNLNTILNTVYFLSFVVTVIFIINF